MNAFTMKLESRQQVEVQNEAKPKGFSGIKKCKSLKKKNNSCNNDKDALLNSHGLGRKFPEKADLNSLNINTVTKYECSKKIRSKKESHKVDRMCANTDRIQERLQRFLSNEDKEKILCILNDIRALSDIEKLYLYLQLPTGSPFEVDPFKQKTPNPLGKKADEEGMFAITWIQSHLEEDPDVSLPKQEVYDEYQSYCNLTGTDPLCAADFGKVMKQIFPSVKPRRLGTRGNSRYCYSGLRKKLKLAPPSVPDIQNENCSSDENFGDEVTAAACHLLFEWAEKLLGIKFNSLKELAAHLLENMYVDNRSVAAFTVLLDASPQLLTKGFSPSEGGVKKSEAQFHLHRKIQEKELIKEQKKKLQEQRSSLVGMNRPKGVSPKKKSIKSRKIKLFSSEGLQHEEKIAINVEDHSKTSIQKNPEDADVRKQNENTSGNSSDILADTDAVVDVVINEFNIKKEDSFSKSHPNEIVSCNKIIEQSLSNLVMSPLSSPSSSLGDIEDSMRKKGKILLPQNKSPVCIAQSLPGIIIVPSLPQLTAEIGKQNANAPKYKRIQPKPLQGETFNTVARSRAGSVGSSLPAKPKARNADGRRSSHAWLQSDSFVENGEEKLLHSTNVNSPFKSVPEKNAPKSISLKDDIRFESPHDQTDKLTLENLSSLSLSSVNILSSEKENKRITELHMKSSHIQTLLSTEAEDGNSAKRHLDEKDDHADNKRVHLDSYRLSKESSIANSSSINISSAQVLSNNQCTRLDHEEVNVHEIEGDALNDYFRGANIQSSVNSLQQNDFEQQHTTHKVKQLSQLRMLLEQNLPSAISKSTISSTKLQKVSKSVDTNENIQLDISDSKKSHLPMLQDSNKTLITNIFFENQDNSTNPISDPSIKGNPQPESLERLLSSSYLAASVEDNTDNGLLSDPTLFLNCSQNSEQDMDIGLHNDFNQNSCTSDMLLSSAILSDTDFSSKGTNPSMSCNRVSTCTQVPSVPQSPNTRRRAFNFMPISPRHTPIPEGIGTNGTSISSMSPHLRTMMSTGVGPSQPPSNSGSPFVSPRSTPVPLCRSRHSSGQSTYSASRHTPFQNFDSGVSSVSSSPFISPQPTPVPVSRLRHNSNHGSNKTVTFCSINSPQVIHSSNSLPHLRTRHSSGPGAHASTGSPCNSLSPLVSEQGSTSSFVFPPGNEIRSRHNSGSNTTTPLSPVSEQASSSSSCTSNIPDLSSVSDISSSVSQSFLNDRAADLLISANPSSFKQVRHRHASSSVIYGKSSYASKDLFSQEIQKLLKNYHENGTSDVLLSNRSQSVPLHQMLQTTDSYCLLTQPVEDSCPKSHPSTPVMNQMFSFPALSSNQEVAAYSLGMDINNRDKSLVQTSQMEWTGFDGSVDLETNSARRNLTTLYDATPLSDDLQTTLEDLRDCDTDFSKLELELRQNEESGL